MGLDRTYELETDPPPSETWEQYALRTGRDWSRLLSSADAREDAYQRFLEDNPAFVPGAHGPSLTSGHMPVHAGVFARPTLPGYAAKQPDFMWIATDSSEITPVLIEIETPDKKWFTAAGVPHHDLTQALNQLAQQFLVRNASAWVLHLLWFCSAPLQH